MNKINLRDYKELEFKNNVIVLDDVFFLHQENSGQEQFEYLIGNKSLESEKINIFISNIQHNERIRDIYGFKYKHIIFPAKATAYSNEFLDIGIEIHQIAPESCTHLDSVYYCDVNQQHYHKDDTHTNAFSLVETLKQISHELGLDDFPEAIFQESMLSLGDLGKMYDSIRRKRIIFSEYSVSNELIKDKIKREEYIKKFSLHDYYNGNSGDLDFILNPFSVYPKRLVLFGDSFFRVQKLRIFYLLFEEIIYIRNPYIQEDIIKVLKPDIVLTGNAERYLINVPDASHPRPYFLNYFTSKFNPNINRETVSGFEALFSGRESKRYKEFKKKKSVNIIKKLKEKPLYELTIDDMLSDKDINLCRDLALQYEETNIKKALYLMEIAHKARPKKKFLQDKYLAYKKAIE